MTTVWFVDWPGNTTGHPWAFNTESEAETEAAFRVKRGATTAVVWAATIHHDNEGAA